MRRGAEALALVGPTASGKTALSLAVARRLDGEVVSLDSRQVYRGMDIGTAKATAAERGLVPHHGLDLVHPGQRYSAGRFARAATEWIRAIRGRGRLPVLVGGTGFFLRALTHPLFREPELPRERRRGLEAWLEALPEEELHRWLAALDPGTAERLRRSGGRQRLIRGIEVALLSGRPLSWWHRHAPPERPPLRVVAFVLELPAEVLDRRIDARVDAMMDAGLLDEVRGLLAAGYGEDSPGLSATGYAELLPVLRGTRTLEEAVAEVKQRTRRYARRQRTWFRHQLGPDAVPLDGTRPLEQLVEEVVERWRSAT